jgi:hypothetical protein
MAHQDFNSAADKKSPYVFDLDREVMDFYRRHPEQKDTLFFLNVSTLPAAITLGEGQNSQKILDLLMDNNDIETSVKTAIKDGTMSVPYADLGYNCIFMNTTKDHKGLNILGHSTPWDVTDAFTFDHEIGHMLGHDDSENNPNMRESIADAYAVIRHFQRFGTDAASITNLIGLRAVEMIFVRTNGDHFTSAVVQQIFADKDKTDFAALTPAETVALARTYAAAHTLHPVSLRRISDGFTSLQNREKLLDLMNIEGSGAAFLELRDLVLTTAKALEFKWGATAIRTFLDAQVVSNGTYLEFPPDQAERLRQKLDAREAEFRKFNNILPPKKEF